MPRLVGQDGVIDVSPGDVDRYLARGYRAENEGEGYDRARAAASADAYGGVLGGVEAGVAGALRGASLGLSDVALGAAGLDERLAALKTENPLISTVSEIGGALAPALLTGGVSLAGRAAAYSPAGAIARAGLGATEAIQAGGGAARSIAGYAAGGVIEGAAQGAGGYISDVALGNKELSAEGFLASAGSGGLWGGAIGGAFGAAERGFVAARKLWPRSEVTREAVQVAEQEVASASSRAIAAGDEADMMAARSIQEIRAGNPAADKAARDAADAWRARQAEASTRKVEAQAGLAEQRLKTAQELDAIKLERARNPKRRGKSPAVADDVPAGAVANDAAPPVADAPPMAATIEEAMEDAMAAVDPKIGELVRKRRDYAFGKSQLPRMDGPADASGTTWKVRGHQGDGIEVLDDAGLAQSTMGRLKDALGKKSVTADQRAAVEKMLTPKRLEALKKYEAGEVRAMPYWFNKEHVFEGKTFRIRDLVDSEDIAETRRLVHGVRSDLERWKLKDGTEKVADPLHHFKKNEGKLSSFADEKPYVDQFGDTFDAELLHNIGVIGDFERSAHALTQALGDAAPMAARKMADDYAGAARKVDEANATSVANVAQHVEAKTALDQATASVSPSTTQALREASVVKSNASPIDAISLPGVAGAAPAAATGQASRAADAAAAMEMMSSFEGLGLPSVANLPLVGPILSLYLKARAAGSIFRRFGGKVPATAEATVASRAAATRNKARAAVGRFLDAGASGSRGAARHAPRAISAALAHVQYDDGQKRDKADAKDMQAQLRARSEEINRAISDEAATRRRLAEQVRATDPTLAQALGDRFMAKQKFLASKLPVDPRPPTPFARAPFKASEAAIEKFARFAHYADNPTDVFDDLADGRVSLEGVETVKAVYPELYADAQRATLDLLASKADSVPYQRRVQMSLVFDVVGDETLSQPYLAAMQAGYAQPAPQQSGGAPTPPQPGLSGDPRRMVDSYQTAFDRRAV